VRFLFYGQFTAAYAERMPVTTPQLITERLLLQPLVSADAEQIQRVFPRWEIVRYLIGTIPWPYPDDGAAQYVNHVALPAAEAGKGWYWTIRRKAEPMQLIGVICLMDLPDNNRGFWLVPEWQGQGLMSEASDAVTRYWFEELDKEVLRAPKAAVNTRSVNFSQRSGMRLVRREKAHYVAGEMDSELWEITREAWRDLQR
jgi:RimJ/RimL family protein N-acetyltransferase